MFSAKLYTTKIIHVILIFIALCILYIYSPFRNIPSTPLKLNSESGDLIGRIYSPKKAEKPLPVVILAHGVSSSKEMMIPLALELARNEIASIVFDFGGFGESYSFSTRNQQSVSNLSVSTVEDAKSILSYIKQHPQEFDQDKIAIVGHSMGGVTAIDLGKQEKSLKATVSLGIGGEADVNSPANLLFAIGVYEQLNPPQTLRLLFSSIGKNQLNCNDNLICGNFQDGTARQLFISPTADHFTAIYDSILIKETIDWIQKSWQLETDILEPVVINFIIGIFILLILLILTLTNLLINNYSLLIRYRLPLIISILLIGFSQIYYPSLSLISNLIIITLFFSLIVNYAYQYPSQWLSRYKIAGYFSLLLCTAFLIPSIGQNIFELFQYPSQIIYLPIFIFKWFIFLIYNIFAKFKTIFFPTYTFQLNVNFLVFLVFVIDSIKLGLVLRIIDRVITFIHQWLNQPFKLDIKNISPRELQILGGLIILLIGTIYLRLRDGLLQEIIGQGYTILRLFILFILIPIMVIIFGICSFKVNK